MNNCIFNGICEECFDEFVHWKVEGNGEFAEWWGDEISIWRDKTRLNEIAQGVKNRMSLWDRQPLAIFPLITIIYLTKIQDAYIIHSFTIVLMVMHDIARTCLAFLPPAHHRAHIPWNDETVTFNKKPLVSIVCNISSFIIPFTLFFIDKIRKKV